jgi:hypothetical protein
MSEKFEYGSGAISRRKDSTRLKSSEEGHGAKSEDLLRPTPKNMPSFAGEYDLTILTLVSPHGDTGSREIDLRGSWSDLNIYEDMFSSTLTADITIVDGVGLLESLPIMGEETITIRVKTKNLVTKPPGIIGTVGPDGKELIGPFNKSDNTGIINLTFKVYKITDNIMLNQGLRSYKLHLVSNEYIINLKQKIQKATLNPATLEPQKISTVVRKLYAQFFGLNGKKIFIEPTRNLVNLVIPNYSPFKSFNFLASRAVSAGQQAVGSSFVFYETVTGYFFVSLETLMSGGGTGYRYPPDIPAGSSPSEGVYTYPESKIKETYTISPKRMDDPNTPKEQRTASELTSIDVYNFSSNFDVIENLTKGMYANRLLTHDLVRMKYDTLDFNYIDKENLRSVEVTRSDGSTETIDKKITPEDMKNFTDGFTHIGKGKLCTTKQSAIGSPESHLSFFPTNFAHDQVLHIKDGIGSSSVKYGSKLGSLNIVPNRVEQWMQQRLVQSQQINNIKLNIRAPGRSSRMIGDLIEVKLPPSFLDARDGKTASEENKYLSGYYLITKLKHHFTGEKYEIEFEAIKDSLKNTAEKEKLDKSVSGSSSITKSGQLTINPNTGKVVGGL